MKYLILIFTILLSSCYSYTVYPPSLEYTEAEFNLTFDRKGFRSVSGWVWNYGTITFEYNKGNLFIEGWEEEDYLKEDWFWIVDDILN